MRNLLFVGLAGLMTIGISGVQAQEYHMERQSEHVITRHSMPVHSSHRSYYSRYNRYGNHGYRMQRTSQWNTYQQPMVRHSEVVRHSERRIDNGYYQQ